MTDHRRIHFALEQDEDGYPPFAVETIWAEALEDGTFRIDNIPFYVYDLSMGDVVTASSDGDQMHYKATKVRSKNSTIRIVFYDRSCVDDVISGLERLDCITEYASGSLMAVNIPADASLKDVFQFLNINYGDKFGYEESAPRYRDTSL